MNKTYENQLLHLSTMHAYAMLKEPMSRRYFLSD